MTGGQSGNGDVRDDQETIDDPDRTLEDPDVTVAGPEAVSQADDNDVTVAADDEQTIVAECLSGLPDETLPGTTIKHVREEDVAATVQAQLKPRDVTRQDGPQLSDPDYVQEQLLGEGGIGSVYAARQKSIDRTVAIKVLKPRAARRESAKKSFVSEAMITGELDHPNIVPVYDMGLDGNDHPFYVMKQVQGVEWADRIAGNSLRENLDILMRVADAIALAHSRGIIHRDLKPANIMLGEFGEVLVMDWGLASPTADNPKAASFPKIRFGGTPSYMAPEMAGGPVERVDRRSDIYLLGALLFEVLTGGPPHHSRTVKDCLKAAEANEIAPTDESGPLMDIARKAMQTQQEDRYQTVQEFQDAIREYFTHLESISLTERAQEDLEQAQESDEYEAYARAVFAFEEACELWSENSSAKAGLSAARLAYAQSALTKHDHDLCGSILDPDDDAHTELRLKLFEEIAESRRLAEEQQKSYQRTRRLAGGLIAAVVVTVIVAFIWISSSRSRAVRLAADNAQLATDAEDKRKDAEAARSEAERNRQLAEEQSTLAQLSADEAKKSARIATAAEARARSLAEESEEQLYLTRIKLADEARRRGRLQQAQQQLRQCRYQHRNWEWFFLNRQCERQLAILRSQAEPVTLALNDDASIIAIGLSDGRIEIHDRDTDTPPVVIAAHASRVVRMDLSKSGERLVSVGEGRTVRVWNTANGESLFERSMPDDAFFRLPIAISDDGAVVGIPAENNEVAVFTIGSSDEPLRLTGHKNIVLWIAFSPNNATAATFSADGRARFWDVQARSQTADIRIRGPLTSLDLVQPRIAFSSSKSAVVSENALWIVDVSTARVVRSIGPSWDSHFTNLHVSRDGRDVLANSLNAGAWLYNGETGLPRLQFPNHRGCALSRSGNVLAMIQGGKAVLWDVRPVIPASQIGDYPNSYRYTPRKRVDIHPIDGLIAVPNGNRINLVTQSGQLVRELGEHPKRVTEVEFSPDGSIMISGSVDGTIRLWDVATGEQIRELEKTDQTWSKLHLSADANYVVAGAKSEVLVWNAANGQFRRSVKRNRTDPLRPGRHVSAFHPVKPWFAVGRKTSVEVYDAKTGERLKEMEGGFSDGAVFSPDGRYLAAADRSALAVWDCESGERLHHRVAHQGRINSVAFSPDGSRIATAGSDTTIRVWDAQSGLGLLVLAPESRPGHSLEFDPSGRFLVSMHDSENVFVWGDTRRRIGPGESIDLLAQTDPARDAVNGAWIKDETGLHVPVSQGPSLEFPVSLSGDYRMTCKFVRDDLDESVSFYFPVDGGQGQLMIDGFPQDRFLTGMFFVDGQRIDKRDDALQGLQLTSGMEHEVSISVVHVQHQVRIEATLDDRPLVDWTGASRSLTANSALRNSDRPGVSTYGSSLRVQSATLELLSGSAVLPYDNGPLAGDE